MKLVFTCAALLLPMPLLAQDDGPSQDRYDAASKSLEELVAKTGDETDPWLERPCELGIPLFDELVSREPGEEFFNHGQLFAGALCDDVREDYEDGLAKVKQLEAGWPDLDFSGLGFYFATRARDSREYLSRLRALDNSSIEDLSPERFWHGYRMIREQGAEEQAEDLMLEWIDERRLAYIPVDMQAGVSSAALSAALRQGRIDVAPQLLGSIRSPDSYIGFLADRKFEPIWPLVEERAGRNLDRIADEYVFWAMGRLENHPRDRDRFSTAATALHYAGRFEDAIALARRWRDRDGAMETIEEGDAWALNIEAYAHDALGEVEQADAVFDQLAALDPEQHPWVVNFVINRASRLVGQERWEEGLEAAALSRRVAEKWGNDFAKMIIARDHVCALQALGRTDSLEAELDFLRENRTESYTLATQALLCAGRREEAAEMLLEGIADERYRDSSMGALMSPKFDLFYTASKLPDPIELLDESPALESAFERFARRIPDEFIPTASIRANR